MALYTNSVDNHPYQSVIKSLSKIIFPRKHSEISPCLTQALLYLDLSLFQSYADVTRTFPKGMMHMLTGLNLQHVGRHHSGIGKLSQSKLIQLLDNPSKLWKIWFHRLHLVLQSQSERKLFSLIII